MRLTATVLLVFGVAAACGGSTEGGGTGGAAATSGSGGTGASSGSGGSGATGGSGTGGSSGSGASSGSGGTAGSGGASGFDDCQYPGDCTLFAKNCCGGYCSEVPISEYLATNSQKLSQVQDAYCDDLVACPDCIYHDQPHYIAACRNAKCVGVDIRNDAITACQTADDCRLRWGSGCCESCAGPYEQLVSVNKSGALEKEVCSPFAGACPPCDPSPYPPGAYPHCVSGHCTVLWGD